MQIFLMNPWSSKGAIGKSNKNNIEMKVIKRI